MISDLIEINAMVKIGEKQYIPSNKFRNLFKMLLHDITIESKDMDEYSAACVVYSTAIKKAREFMMSKKLFPGVEVPVQ